MGVAMAGQRRAKEGLRKVVGGLQQGVESLSAALAGYRMFCWKATCLPCGICGCMCSVRNSTLPVSLGLWSCP
jgi:hypothetical protein